MDNNSQSVAVEQTTAAAKKTRRRRKAKRTLAGGFALAIGLSGAGVLASALTPDAQVATAEKDDQALVQEGKEIYDVACITCHGANLQGVEDRGPSLIGTGEGAVYFQVNSGRMPMMSNDAQAERKRPRYTEEQALALAAYVAANGGGPELVYNEDGSLAMEDLRQALLQAMPAMTARYTAKLRTPRLDRPPTPRT